MSVMKRLADIKRDVYTIGGKYSDNPYIGRNVKCIWKKRWGGYDPGYIVEGELLNTFCVNGRTLIGEVKTSFYSPTGQVLTKKIACPWSRNYLDVIVLD